MPKTKFERLDTGGAQIAAFRISGKLGFHENLKIEHLADECLKRRFKKVVFDFSELTSLGGGVARILRGFLQTFEEQGGEVKFVITSDIVLDFLQDENTSLSVCRTLEEAMAGCDYGPGSYEADEDSGSDPGLADEILAAGIEAVADEPDESGAGDLADDEGEAPEVIMMSYDGDSAADADQGGAGGKTDSKIGPAEVREGEKVISEIFDRSSESSPPEWIEKPESPFEGDKKATEEVKKHEKESGEELNRKLKRRILELKALFSISSDFNAIKDKKKLLDIFLLTSIAQGGVESAIFYEKTPISYQAVMFKGMEKKEIPDLILTPEEEESAARKYEVSCVSDSDFSPQVLEFLESLGLEYYYPFNMKEGIAGLIFLGRRITGRGMQKEDFEFMKILINVARGAYHNAVMLEHEHERTLGIVKTLISLIEENTLLKGTSEFVSRYVGMVAKNMNYPEEHFKDLIYGTVLRDMGMIKVSDLIVRSPRELSKDEWSIINRHPEDGADMLRRMKFSKHVVDIVLSHHERFNGEGYPRGLRGKEIPLGARIISVVESYSAMINERPNRPALSEKEALDTLKENYGLRYDREVVKQFAKIIEKEIAKSVRPNMAVS